MLWSAVLMVCTPALSTGSPASSVRVGAYLQRLHALSLKENTFTVDLYLWFRWDPEDFERSNSVEPRALPFETVEFVGASAVEQTLVSHSEGYACLRIKLEQTQFWQVGGFPFDDHRLRIVIEDAASELHLLKYVADVEGSSVSPDFRVPGWAVRGLSVGEASHEYRTSFGDPTLPTGNRAQYAQVTFEVPLERHGIGLFLKLFTGLFVSVAIALVAFFIQPTSLDPRFGLPVGALFAAVASEYVVASALPDSGTLSLADLLHLVSFVAILAVVVESAWALRRLQTGGDAVSRHVRRVDLRSFWGVGCSWLAAVIGLCVLVV